jgi:hypothetical protein
MGWTCPQNAKGHVLGHVKDLGHDATDPSVRLYSTCAAQPFHTDSADLVGLLCLERSQQGGASQVDAHTRPLSVQPEHFLRNALGSFDKNKGLGRPGIWTSVIPWGQVVSSAALWNELVRTRPDLAQVLSEPFPVWRCRLNPCNPVESTWT